MTTRNARRILWWRTAGMVVLGAVALAGCAEVGQTVQTAVDTMSTAFQPKEQPAAEPLPTSYCYRTIGKVNCYTQPLPGSEANRLVGYQGPPPRSSSGTGPLSP